MGYWVVVVSNGGGALEGEIPANSVICKVSKLGTRYLRLPSEKKF